jgi:Na+/H+-dicarboxylate symporter
MKLWVKILIGFALGAVVGLIVGPSIAVVKPLGDLFIRLIKMLIVPMVFCSLVVGASSIGDLRKLGRVGGKTIIYFLATTAIAITLAIIFAIIFNPAGGYVLKEVGTYEAKAMPKVADVILNMVPTNPISAMATDNMLQIIVFALFVGISISLIGEKGKPALDFFDSVAEIMYRIVGMVMNFAPIGVFALIAWVVGTAGAEVLLPLARVIFVVYFVNILHAVVVYSGAVRIFAGMSPVQFFKGFFEATMVAFSTCSSSATLPISMTKRKATINILINEDMLIYGSFGAPISLQYQKAGPDFASALSTTADPAAYPYSISSSPIMNTQV